MNKTVSTLKDLTFWWNNNGDNIWIVISTASRYWALTMCQGLFFPCTKCFPYVSSFNPHEQPAEFNLLFFPSYRLKYWGKDRWRNLPKATGRNQNFNHVCLVAEVLGLISWLLLLLASAESRVPGNLLFTEELTPSSQPARWRKGWYSCTERWAPSARSGGGREVGNPQWTPGKSSPAWPGDTVVGFVSREANAFNAVECGPEQGMIGGQRPR